jgi:hypothetical protein
LETHERDLDEVRRYGRIIALEINSVYSVPTNVVLLVNKRVPKKGLLNSLFRRTEVVWRPMQGWDLSTEIPWDTEAVALGTDGNIYATTVGKGPKKAVILPDDRLSGNSLDRVNASLKALDQEHFKRRK